MDNLRWCQYLETLKGIGYATGGVACAGMAWAASPSGVGFAIGIGGGGACLLGCTEQMVRVEGLSLLRHLNEETDRLVQEGHKDPTREALRSYVAGLRSEAGLDDGKTFETRLSENVEALDHIRGYLEKRSLSIEASQATLYADGLAAIIEGTPTAKDGAASAGPLNEPEVARRHQLDRAHSVSRQPETHDLRDLS